MAKRIAVLASVLLLVCMTLGVSLARAEKPAYVHFVVASVSSDAAGMPQLKQGFLELAGGYTQVPNTFGSSMNDGKAKAEEENTSFLVAADKNISKEIQALAQKALGGDVFILVWQGSME